MSNILCDEKSWKFLVSKHDLSYGQDMHDARRSHLTTRSSGRLAAAAQSIARRSATRARTRTQPQYQALAVAQDTGGDAKNQSTPHRATCGQRGRCRRGAWCAPRRTRHAPCANRLQYSCSTCAVPCLCERIGRVHDEIDNLRHVHLSYKLYFFSQRTGFFSHNKSANSSFSHDFSVRRTRPLDSWSSLSCVQEYQSVFFATQQHWA
jgi:hypothetical protein